MQKLSYTSNFFISRQYFKAMLTLMEGGGKDKACGKGFCQDVTWTEREGVLLDKFTLESSSGDEAPKHLIFSSLSLILPPNSLFFPFKYTELKGKQIEIVLTCSKVTNRFLPMKISYPPASFLNSYLQIQISVLFLSTLSLFNLH